MMRQLPLITEPKPAESFYGYISRLTELNKYTHPSLILELCGESGFKRPSVAQMMRVAPFLPQVSGSLSGTLNSMLYHDGGTKNHRTFVFKDEHFDHQDLSLVSPGYCPKCLAEFGYFLRIWDFKHVVACPRHKCLMLFVCPRCSRECFLPSRWVYRCSKCQYDLRLAPTSSAAYGLTAVSALLSEKIGAPFICNTKNIPQFWTNMGLSDTSAHLRLLVRHHPGLSPLHNLVWRETGAECIRLVAQVILDWPHGFHNYLQCLLSSRGRQGHQGSGLHAAFGRFYRALANEPVSDRFNGMLQEISRFAMNDPSQKMMTGRGNSPVYNEEIRKRHYFTKQEVKSILKISSARFDRLRKSGAIVGYKLEIGNQHIYRVAANGVLKYKEKLTTSLSRKNLVVKLGMSRPYVDSLLSRGYLQALEQPAPGGSQKYLVERREVEKLLARLYKSYRPAYVSKDVLMNFKATYHTLANRRRVNSLWTDDVLWQNKIFLRAAFPHDQLLNQLHYCTWDIDFLAGRLWIPENELCRGLSTHGRVLILVADLGKHILVREKAGSGIFEYFLPDAIKFAENYISLRQLQTRVGSNISLHHICACVSDDDLIGVHEFGHAGFVRVDSLIRTWAPKIDLRAVALKIRPRGTSGTRVPVTVPLAR